MAAAKILGLVCLLTILALAVMAQPADVKPDALQPAQGAKPVWDWQANKEYGGSNWRNWKEIRERFPKTIQERKEQKKGEKEAKKAQKEEHKKLRENFKKEAEARKKLLKKRIDDLKESYRNRA